MTEGGIATTTLLNLAPAHGRPVKIILGDTPVYCISLPTAVTRRAIIQEQALHLGLHLNMVCGVSLHKNPLQDVPQGHQRELDGLMFTLSSLRIGHKERVRFGELGCTLAHIRAIRKICVQEQEWALIIEDDIALAVLPYWRKTLQEIIDSVGNKEIIRFGSSHRQPKDSRCLGGGTYTYAISKEGAQRFMRNHIDKNYVFTFDSQSEGGAVADYYLYTHLRTTIHTEEAMPHSMDWNKSSVNPNKMHDAYAWFTLEMLRSIINTRVLPQVVNTLQSGDLKASVILPGVSGVEANNVLVDPAEIIRIQSPFAIKPV
jgi:GR25 family glycosyltransferase involved in LPS biosynthesis